jgi:hypothetical protein
VQFGVIHAEKAFAENRFRIESLKCFDELKERVRNEQGIDIECCREVYVKAGRRLFALVSDVLINAYANPPEIKKWAERE